VTLSHVTDPLLGVRGRVSPTSALVGVGAVLLALLHVRWLVEFRWDYITDWDEAGYISIALSDVEGLTTSPRAFVDAVGHSLGTQPPVVPVSAAPLLLAFGRSADVAQLTIPIWSILLVLATYGVARHLMSPRWAALAALALGTTPVVSDFARLFHFAVPAAALLTAALWALLNSSGLRRTGWVIAAGVLLALMLTARTMTVGYLPGVAIGVGLPLLLEGADRRLRIRNFALLWSVALGIAAIWWVPVWSKVTGYLTTAGYGSEATGVQNPVLSLDYWTTELGVVGNHLYLPLTLTLLACFVAAGAVAITGKRASLKRCLTSDAALLAIVVGEGYLALSTTANQGTAFALPWLPSLIVLGVGAASAVPARPVRTTLAALLVAACALNLAMKNGVSSTLSQPELARLPVLGNVTVLDGRDFLYLSLDVRGYPVKPPPAQLPAMHKEWTTLNDRLVRFMASYAATRGRTPSVAVGTGDWFINDTRLALASELIFRRGLDLRLIRAEKTVDAYGRQLADLDQDFLILSDPPPAQQRPMNQLALAAAALRLGFREVKTLRAPDARRVRVWARGSVRL
jgi:4-amino-4-deoxy-L-arabinose transferase-like glycosyltransferase